MVSLLLEALSYPFMLRALIAGTLISLVAALLGVSLVLKRYAMIGDSLSHVGFGALALAAAMGWAPLAVAIPVVVLAAFLLLRIRVTSRIKSDAALALISSSALAGGVLVLSLTTGMNTDVYNYMFGSILAMSEADLRLSLILGAVVLLLFLLFYERIFAITFDETFARATGVHADFYNTLLALLAAVTIVLGMRMMGALLISALIIFPPLSAMRVCRRFRSVALVAALLAVCSFVLGLAISYLFATPTGASVVLVELFFFLLCSLLGALLRRA